MKMKTVFCVGLGAVMLFSLAGFAPANAEQIQTESQMSAAIEQVILCQDGENGLLYSVNGAEWIAQSDYEKNHSQVEWWTAAEYESWIAEQRVELEALIGTGNGWYDGQGVYHEWTQEIVDAQIGQYERILEEIKAGVLYSKPNENNIGYVQISPNADDIISVYSADFVKSDGSSVHIGNCETVDELKEAIDNAVEDGRITREEAKAVSYQ